MAENETWLNQVREVALEPALEIIDPHHHLWDYPHSRYLSGELAADIAQGHRVTATVYVECMSGYRGDGPEHLRVAGETAFAAQAGAAFRNANPNGPDLCAGIVATADLTAGALLETVLDAHEAAGQGRFRGIRHATGWDPSPDVRNSHSNPPQGLMTTPAYIEGARRLGQRGLSLDAWFYHHQIPELTALADACPDTRIILDHFGGPLGIGPYAGQRDAIFARWKGDIAELAKRPNVAAKLGGIAMAVNGFDWQKQPRPPSSSEYAAAVSGWFHHAIDCFGPDRAMFESNFPVDRISLSYGVLWNGFKRLAARYSADEKAALFSGTARAVYRLG